MCNVIFRNMYSVKYMIQKGGTLYIVEVKLPSHRKSNSTEAFMFSGGLPVYWILYSGEADGGGGGIIIITKNGMWRLGIHI